jgi:L-alanine-DL-glutamate epimerase-like enolase superfamily enzyme
VPDVEIENGAGSGSVTGFEVIPYALPFKHPYVTARGILEQREMVLLRVHTADGLVGLGEAVPLSLRGGTSLDAVVAELSNLRDEYRDATSSSRYEILLKAFKGFSAPSRCALHTAWFDFGGKAQNMPAWQLLGGYEATPLACNATLTADEPAAVAEQAAAWASDGFATFKLKAGVEHDADQVARVREAVGPEAKLRVDANGAWSPEEALSKLEQMAEHGIELAEQPCASLEDLSRVRAETDVPIAGDESIETAEDAKRAIAAGACDLATIKLSKVGGPMLSRGVAVAIPSYMSSALDGPVGIAAAAHAAQALYPMAPDERYDEHYEGGRDPGVAHGLATQRLFAETIASRECELRDGFLHLPEGPGLGVEIDDAALERHRL